MTIWAFDSCARRYPGVLRTLAIALAVAAFLPGRAVATQSLASITAHSPDDISGFTSLTGDDNTASVTLPFTFTIQGTNFTTLVISTNGWIEFGANTSGSSDTLNTCLPVSNHTNPFLAAYWDDLVPFGTNVRYGTVGAVGNRTFIVDYETDLFAGSEGSDDIRFQVQLHERSNEISVRYRDQQSATNGIAATIGFQGAGGAAATTVLPLTCNGKILDDNRPNEGWSVDVGRAGLATMAAVTMSSPDDISGFTTLTGDENTATVALPFSVTIEGTSYSSIVLSTNGWIEFGANTSGGTDFNNGCLPVSNHTNPFLAAYWDDLVPFGTNIRYGTLGTSPNRTFIADFETDLFNGEGSDDVRFQVQIHERSNLISVRYRDAQNNANGQLATIGFQGAGGSAAAAYPITCNGKVLDDNLSDRDGWSVHPKTQGAMSLHSILAHSPDDITGFTTITGDSTVTSVTLPFSMVIDGTSYGTIAVSTNGWIEFGTNTSGSSDPVNACLPVANHTNPFLAAYWDDMTTASTNIRHGTVGTAPNRTFVADFYLLTTTGADDSGNDDVAFQVLLHETSNTISVKYNLEQGVVNGQSATIGFQNAGGSGATAYPLTCNGKILDDNRVGEGWSIAPLPICGNSLVETKEQCDLGGSNGAATTCCTSVCAFRAAGQTCRTSAGVCDVAETCTGSSATCPADAFAGTTTTCRPSAGVCDPAEVCPGGSPNCPVNTLSGTTVTCRASAGVCDPAEVCPGGSPSCPADTVSGTTVTCRASAGVCDPAEVCPGGSPSCPADTLSGTTVTCRASAGVCDPAEVCPGGSPSCPANTLSGTTVTCRASAGVCDPAEVCPGGSPSCPADTLSGTTVTCRSSAGVCDPAEVCPGGSPSCPADTLSGTTVTCRASAGVCDPAEVCPGGSPSCPADTLSGTTVTCRASAGVCDPAEVCPGGSPSCPADTLSGTTVTCRASAGVCDPAEVCPGGSPSCPADTLSGTTVTCRASAGVCDPAEVCPGGSPSCPADTLSGTTVTCRASAGICDPAEVCPGGSPACPADTLSGTTVTCRASTGVCDPAEVCPGGSPSCPGETFLAASTVCRSSAGICDVAENCTGSSGPCPTDVFVPSTTVCRVGSGDLCDPAENCTGGTAACPADAVSSSSTVCNTGSGDLCDPDENCTGTAGQPCPADFFEPGTTVCRSASDVCDVNENCPGVADQGCPADSVSGAFVVCRATAGPCDVAENCDGINKPCPTDQFTTGNLCRAAAGECDVAEDCDGSGAACPTDDKDPLNTPCTGDGNPCSSDVCDGVGNLCTHPAGNPGALCRAAAGICDVVEQCTGLSTSCPADGYASTSMVCRPVSGVCDTAENCPGGGPNCPADTFAATSVVCRPAAGVCDTAENCTSTGPNCPADSFLPSSTTCRASAGVCDVAENCTGSAAACPGNAFQPTTTVCRSSIAPCDLTENCNGSGSACPADATSPDSDGDSVCDAIDDCPNAPDPSQADSDGDDIGDACDLCTNLLPSFADRAKVVVGKLGTPPGDDTVKIKGRCAPFQETPAIDPAMNGMRVVMEDDVNTTPIDVTLPGGAYSNATKAGWKVHTFPAGITAQYKNAGTVVPLINGIKKLKFVIRNGQGITKYTVTGKTGSYPLGVGATTVKVTLIVDPPLAETGQCCEMLFPGPAPTFPSCSFVGGGSTLRCK